MAYTLKKIAAAYDRNISTTLQHIKKLKQEGKFIKRSPGKQYNREELQQLEELLCFKYKEQI
jgi:DNA-binding MarR family transcriptional regulator